MIGRIAARIRESAEVKLALLESEGDRIAQAAEILIDVYRRGGQAIFFGNGGSAADAVHLAAELVGRYLVDRPALPALALPANPSAVTAIANDYGYPAVFARQVEAHCRAGDCAIGLSTSGTSANVLAGLEAAARRGGRCIGLSGEDPGPMRALCDVVIRVPSRRTPRIQECHILVGHILCELVEAALFPVPGADASEH